jgi:hypothetical protein
MEEKNESRINIEDLPQASREVTMEEAKDLKGGTQVLEGGQLQPGAQPVTPRSKGSTNTVIVFER